MLLSWRSSTLLLSDEVKYLDKIRGGQIHFTIRGAQVPCYYQWRSSAQLLSEELKYLVTISGGQVPCYNQGQTNW